MGQSENCDSQLNYSKVVTAASELLTEVQWLVLNSDTKSLDSLAEVLGVARAGVLHRQRKAIEKIREEFREEIACFSERVDDLIAAEGDTLMLKQCLKEFPELNEDELKFLLTVSF